MDRSLRSLVRRSASSDDDDSFPFVAPVELIAVLDNSVSSAKAGGSGWPDYLEWLDSARLALEASLHVT